MIDFEKIKTLYKIGKSLNFSDINALILHARKKKFEVGECLIEEGSTKREMYFVIKGLVRTFKRSRGGEDEVTVYLWWENQMLGSYDILFFNEPSQFYIQALERTEVLVIDYELLEKIISENPKLEVHRKFISQEVLRQFTKRIESFVLLSPEERYINFVKSNPQLINRISDKHIANIVGITPVSLSRIRKRISMKKNDSVFSDSN